MKIITSIRKFRQADAVIVVDVFRSSAAICYGLRNGVREFRVVDTLENVLALAGKDDLKIGEKLAQRPAGFDMTTSPTDILSEKARGARAVYSSANLSHVLCKNGPRENVFIGTFCNAYSLAKAVRKFKSVNFVACSSSERDFFFRFEDLVGIGKIIHELKKFEKLEMDLLSKISLILYENLKTNSLVICPTTYALAILGSLEQVRLCTKENNLSVVPVCKYEKGFVSVKSI